MLLALNETALDNFETDYDKLVNNLCTKDLSNTAFSLSASLLTSDKFLDPCTKSVNAWWNFGSFFII